jgi:hypothetical protein
VDWVRSNPVFWDEMNPSCVWLRVRLNLIFCLVARMKRDEMDASLTPLTLQLVGPTYHLVYFLFSPYLLPLLAICVLSV